ncbi:hypothetical protein TNCV_2633551 [Trichonephila clavipes]|nr:hypothetical protein TNCV_2633551 [Trichonephila clavipes]
MCPETRPLYRSRAPAGEGKNAGRQSGRLKAVNQGSDQARQEPSIKDAVQGSEGSVVNRGDLDFEAPALGERFFSYEWAEDGSRSVETASLNNRNGRRVVEGGQRVCRETSRSSSFGKERSHRLAGELR